MPDDSTHPRNAFADAVDADQGGKVQPCEPVGSPWNKSKRVWFAVFTAIGTAATVASILGHLNPKIQVAAGVFTAIAAGLNQYFGFKATGPVTGRN